MTGDTRTRQDRAVAGIHVTEWLGRTGSGAAESGAGMAVLGLPGLGSSGYAWQPIADSLPDARVLGVHLRGRGLSAAVAGSSGLDAHARDVARVADELDLRDVVLIGHSMGAYLAVVAAARMSARVDRIVLLDGGLPPKFPWPLSSSSLGPKLTRMVFARNLKRSAKTWDSADAFIERSFGKTFDRRPDLIEPMTAIMLDELDITPTGTRARLDVGHTLDDAVDTFYGKSVLPALEALTVPTHLLAATSGKDDKARPLLADSVVAEWTRRLDVLTAERVTCNHVTLLFAPEVIRAIGA